MKLRLLLWLLLLLPGVAHSQTADDNGIFVGEPKVYDDRSLQILLNTARANLARLQPLDITGLTSRIGNIQGADVTQNQFSLQAGGLPTAQNALTTAGGTPSTVLTTTGGLTGGTSNTVAGGVSTTGGNTTTTGNVTTVNTTGTTSGNTLVTTTPSTTFSNVNTQSSVSPLMPSLPGASTVTLPSATGISALDALGEQMQLTYEIANLQLLLEGSLSDHFIPGTRIPKQHTTIGFPISIMPPEGDDYKNAVAEVEITVVNAREVSRTEPPAITAILPREKTYNVANIRESSFSVSAGAVVAGLLNVGGGFFHGHRTFYLLKDQDTVALYRSSQPYIEEATKNALPLKSTTFAWQFKPVLGQKTVVPGLRQTFVQLAIATPDDLDKPEIGCVAKVNVVTRWLRYNPKTGRTGAVIQKTAPRFYDIPNFDLRPEVKGVSFQDVGNGSIAVTVKGRFMDGTHVRVGNLIFDNSTPQVFLFTPAGIQFIAPAQQIASLGAFVVNRGGTEIDILDPDPRVRVRTPDLPLCVPQSPTPTEVSGPSDGFIFTSAPQGAEFVVDSNPAIHCKGACRLTLPSGQHTVTATLEGYEPYTETFVSPGDVAVVADLHRRQYVRIESVGVSPFNDTNSQLRIVMDRVPPDVQNATPGVGTHVVEASNPLVVLVGPKLFGLNDSPLEIIQENHKVVLRLVVPTSLLTTYHSVTVERMFWGKAFSDSRDIKESLDTSTNDSEFAIAKLNLLSDGELTVFAVTGSHLNNVTVISPAPQTFETLPAGDTNATIGLLKIDKEKMKNLKQIVLRKGNGAVVILPLPDDSKAKPKPAVKDDRVSVTPGTQSIEILGTALDQTATIKCQGKLLTFRFLKDKGSLVVDLSTITVTEGVRFLDITFADGTASRFQVEVAAKKTP